MKDLKEDVRLIISRILLTSFYPALWSQELDIVYKVPHAVPISAHHKWNFDDLLETIWEYLKLVRIYTKPKGELHLRYLAIYDFAYISFRCFPQL